MTISTIDDAETPSEIAPSVDQLARVALKAREQVADLEPLAAPHRVAAEQEAAHQRRE